ncbi:MULTISPECIES: tRNA lysidine(34) synthetase TilS [Pseudomonas]
MAFQLVQRGGKYTKKIKVLFQGNKVPLRKKKFIHGE